MGSKNNPGEFDCYAAADPDEPLFTVLARCRLSPPLVRLYAAVRGRDLVGAHVAFNDLLAASMTKGPADTAKLAEARGCAAEMESWREDLDQGSNGRSFDGFRAGAVPGADRAGEAPGDRAPGPASPAVPPAFAHADPAVLRRAFE